MHVYNMLEEGTIECLTCLLTCHFPGNRHREHQAGVFRRSRARIRGESKGLQPYVNGCSRSEPHSLPCPLYARVNLFVKEYRVLKYARHSHSPKQQVARVTFAHFPQMFVTTYFCDVAILFVLCVRSTPVYIIYTLLTVNFDDLLYIPTHCLVTDRVYNYIIYYVSVIILVAGLSVSSLL